MLRPLPVVEDKIHVETYRSIAKLNASDMLINVYLHTPTKISIQLSLQAIQYFIIYDHPAETIRTKLIKCFKEIKSWLLSYSQLISLMKTS